LAGILNLNPYERIYVKATARLDSLREWGARQAVVFNIVDSIECIEGHRLVATVYADRRLVVASLSHARSVCSYLWVCGTLTPLF
jgi:hypothetical protein